jgi:hypothetical protein
MSAPLDLGAAVVAIGNLALVVTSVRHRVVLGALVGLIGLASVGFAGVNQLSGAAAAGAILIAAILLVVGVVLYCLGQAFERLLDEPPEHTHATGGGQHV